MNLNEINFYYHDVDIDNKENDYLLTNFLFKNLELKLQEEFNVLSLKNEFISSSSLFSLSANLNDILDHNLERIITNDLVDFLDKI